MAENEALKDQVQELSIDLDIIKNEISESGKLKTPAHFCCYMFCVCVCAHVSVCVPYSCRCSVIAGCLCFIGYEGAAASSQLKQLEHQNARLKEALVR